jgi:two-component system CheB/CheR fusion protein
MMAQSDYSGRGGHRDAGQIRPDILIVDDDATLREGLIELFRMEGLSAVGSSTGSDALFLLQKGLKPRVMLVDLDMPVMNGWELIRALGTLPSLPDIPVIVMSGIAPESLAPRPAHEAGFFRKPVNFDRLMTTIKGHLGFAG